MSETVQIAIIGGIVTVSLAWIAFKVKKVEIQVSEVKNDQIETKKIVDEVIKKNGL